LAHTGSGQAKISRKNKGSVRMMPSIPVAYGLAAGAIWGQFAADPSLLLHLPSCNKAREPHFGE
jgi:hypothetical protein